MSPNPSPSETSLDHIRGMKLAETAPMLDVIGRECLYRWLNKPFS
jgi:hypothetical protein